MKIISFTQGTEEWHRWRKNGVGASDISVIMGSNPYSTPLQLWEKKCGYREEDVVNRAMQNGIDNEPIARDWLNKHLQLNLKPICVEDTDKPYFKASLDGYDIDKKILCEIKCPASVSTLERAIDSQAVHSYWFDQMQWQMMLTGANRSIMALWDQWNHCCHTLEMYPHVDKISIMREKAEEFWNGVTTGRSPPPTDADFLQVEDPELEKHLLAYQDLCEQEKVIIASKKKIKPKIEAFGDDGNFMAYGFKIKRVNSSPGYDHTQMKLDGINLEKYLKKTASIGYYRISMPKE